MYTNTSTSSAHNSIGKFALENEKYLAVPTVVLMDAFRVLRTNNIFQFGDTYWLQKVGNSDESAAIPTSAPLGHDPIWYS